MLGVVAPPTATFTSWSSGQPASACTGPAPEQLKSSFKASCSSVNRVRPFLEPSFLGFGPANGPDSAPAAGSIQLGHTQVSERVGSAVGSMVTPPPETLRTIGITLASVS
jgi:hypothetical protein